MHVGLCLDAVAVHILEILTFASKMSDELRYASAWDVAIAVTNLHGSRPIASFASPRATSVGAFGNGYEAARYIRTARADVAELARQPGAVLDRLIGQLARAMYSEGYLKPLTDPQVS